MSEMIVKLTFDENELGKDWMNIFNLEVLLYSKHCTRRDLLSIEEVETAACP